MNVFRTAYLVAKKDLTLELRTGEILLTTGFFSLLVAVLTSLAFFLDDERGRRLAPGVLWITIAFTGVLAVGRAWAREREHDAIRALLLAPLSRPGIFLGKLTGSLMFVGAVEFALIPLIALLFRLDVTPYLGALGLLVGLGTLGFLAAGTLFSSLSLKNRSNEVLLTIMIFPLVAPALLAGVVATRDLLLGAPLAETFVWARILAAFDMIFVVGGAFLFEPLLAE